MANTGQPERAKPALALDLDADGWRLDAADFPGCQAIRIPRDDLEGHEGRLEYWDSRTETAMVVCEPTTSFHERPSQRLARLAERIAAVSGTVIETFGTTDLVRFFDGGRPRVLMQADQVVYVRPDADAMYSPRIDVDGQYLPDVILEVDYSTDVRRGKLPRYEAWGFPEVWVDVPDERYPGRPKSRLPGLTIHLLESGRFVKAEKSRAFPGWTPGEIHRALNEPATSNGTFEVLHRVGTALGVRHGTGPDDDLWLRRQRDEGREEGRVQGREEGRIQGREEGRVQGRQEGREEGRVEGLLAGVIAVLGSRGIPAPPDLVGRLASLADRPPAELMAAAQACRSAEDLLNQLGG